MENQTPSQPEDSGGGLLWLLQALSGALLILVLGLHMFAHHFVVEGGLRTYADVLAYISDPLVFVIELIFLLVVTIHAMLGLRAIIIDLEPGKGLLQVTNIGLSILGVLILAYGIWLALTLQSLARS
jgi:succinate dehydrogenase / fumarate reductase membrane anchor subunit